MTGVWVAVVGVAIAGLALGYLLASRRAGRPVAGPSPGPATTAPDWASSAKDRAQWARDRRTAELATREVGRWTELIERLPMGIVVARPDGQVINRNQNVEAMSGTHVGVLVDQAIKQVIGECVVGVATPRRDVASYGPPRLSLDVTGQVLADGWIVVSVIDQSERLRLDAVRTDFVANISHELKTPVGALAILAETLADEDDLTIVRRVADRMVGESHRVARTIDDLMELSRIELGEQPRRDRVEALDVVRGAVERTRHLAEKRSIRLEVLDVPAGAAVVGDRRQLVSALGNIVENAVKYSHECSSVQIRVIVHGPSVEFMVADTGIGIPPGDHARIFERFYRVDKARSRDTGGTGLGLSIVRHIATNHRGDVLVSSREGEGSTFVLRLPGAAAHRGVPSAPPAQTEPREA